MNLRARFVLVVLLVLAGGAAAAAAPGNPARAKQELHELRARIEALQKKIAETEEVRNEAADALKESERAISDANRALAELGAQSREANGRLAQLRAESQAGAGALQKQQAALARLLYQQYLNGTTDPFKLVLNREDPNALGRQLQYLAHASRARATFIADLRQNLARVGALAREAEEKAREIAAITTEQSAQRVRLEQEKRKRMEIHKRASREIDLQRREIGTLKRNETRLTHLIEQLGRIIARKPAPGPRQRVDRVPDPGAGSGPFAQLRGRLALPVRGELAGRFGGQRSGGGVTWKGLFIAARPGDEVRTVAAGRVVYADWLRGFGNLMIIDHDDGYLSLYGYNEALLKRVGDAVRGGETIAAVGNSGGGAESGLYFELRYQGKPFDPLPWVGGQ